MASRVVVIATDLRRTTISVQPGTYLTDVLEEACKKLNLSSERYLLKHNKKQVNLALPFRTANLPPGAKLELVLKSNTPSVVSVALQMPQPEAKDIPGGRLSGKFPSDITIWRLLRQFESGTASAGRNLNITGRGVAQTGSGQLYYETPVLNLVGRELATFVDFQKTLSQLGYESGSVLIRLSYRTTDKTFYDATTEISEYFREEALENNTPTPGPSTSNEAAPTVDMDEKVRTEQGVQPTDGTSEATDQPTIQTPAINSENLPNSDTGTKDIDMPDSTDPLLPVGVFSAPSSATPAAALTNEADQEYELTIAQAKSYQATLKERGRNQRLLSDRELEEQEAARVAKVAAVKSVLMRVRFPDGMLADWAFGPEDTGATLYQAVRKVMANPTLSFKLLLPAEKVTIKDEDGPKHSLIKGYKLAGKVLVTVLWDDSVPEAVRKQAVMKASVVKDATVVPVPAAPEAVEEAEVLQPAPPARVENNREALANNFAKKASKFLRLGKK